MVKGMKNLSYTDTLKELGLFSLDERRLREEIITLFLNIKDICKEARGSLFTRSHMEMIRHNEFQLYQERFLQ